jgi:uncharacterized protein YggL (DUF469 family)
VNKYTVIITTIILLCFSCENQKNSSADKDFYLLHLVLKKYKEKISIDKMKFILSNDNRYAIKVLKDYKNTFETGDSVQIKELIQSTGLDRLSEEKRNIIKSILSNKRELEYAISQESIANWDSNFIDSMYLNSSDRIRVKKLRVSKPIYNRAQNIALIEVANGNTLGVFVYFVEEEWKELGLIAPLITQSKVTD